MNKIITLVAVLSLGIQLFKAPASDAARCGMTEEEFIFISSVVEAESDRCTDSTEGRRYIALVILNRVADDRFPDTISEVLCQPNQFSTVRNSQSVVSRTELSDQAVIEAVEWLESGDAPTDLLFFNCRGYNIGEPYGMYGGNYFMRLEAEEC